MYVFQADQVDKKERRKMRHIRRMKEEEVEVKMQM